VVSDDFEYTNAKPNIHFAEHQHGSIFNLTFSNQPEGLQQFDQVCAILDAIKAHTVSSLRPLASLAEVRSKPLACMICLLRDFFPSTQRAIFNLTVSNQPEGLEQFDQVCAILDAIKAHTVDSLRPLSSLAEVCRGPLLATYDLLAAG
jgi:hypothetical protein